MNEIDTVQSPALAMPSRPEGRLTLRQFLRVVRDNSLATYPPEAFEEDIIARRLLWRRRFIINEPNAIRHVLLDNAANYTKSELSRRLLEPGLGRGLLTSEGETWRRHRRIMAPAFDHRSIMGYAPIITEVTAGLLEQWDALADSIEIDVAAAMMHTTLHIISRAMFSSDSDEIVDVVERGVGQYQATVRPNLLDLLRFPVWLSRRLSFRRATGAFDEFDKSVDRLLSTRGREPNSEPKDLLARLVAARDTETGGGMTAQEVRDQVVTIFMAGHETTAQALAWTWYLLSLHPAAEAKLHDELSTVLAGRTPRYEDLASLRYTRMVIEESMRLYPPAHTMAREPIASDHVLGHLIPAGALVLIVPWLLHRKPSLWEHPDRFDPERFSSECESASSIDPQSYRRKPMSSGGFSEDRWGHDWTSINHVNRLNSGVGVGIQRQFAVGSKLDADLHELERRADQWWERRLREMREQEACDAAGPDEPVDAHLSSPHRVKAASCLPDANPDGLEATAGRRLNQYSRPLGT